MNAGIVVLKDGTPCIAYDEKLPFPIRHVEFCREDFQVTLIYKVPGTSKISNAKSQGKRFEFPLDHPFVKLLEDMQMVACAMFKGGELSEIKMYPVVFVEKRQNSL